jgi:hypothetical protein
MSGKSAPQLQLLLIKTCTPTLIVKTTISQGGNFDLTSQTFVGHINLSLANSQATIFQISVGSSVQNL